MDGAAVRTTFVTVTEDTGEEEANIHVLEVVVPSFLCEDDAISQFCGEFALAVDDARAEGEADFMLEHVLERLRQYGWIVDQRRSGNVCL